MYLAELEARKKNPAQVGVVGIGRMGRGVVDQVTTMPGMRLMAAADVDLGRAEACLRENGADPLVTDQLGPAQDALRQGRPVATGDASLIPQLELDAVVESTGVPEIGARVAADAIEHRRHVVMLNVEADVVVGPILAERARRAGVVYTLAAGDQPGAIFELAEWAQTLGFRVVCAGRGTVLFADDHHATPDTYREQAERNKMNPKMYSSFRDGTKSQTEMAAVSNVLRMPPEVRGMHEPHCRWQDLGKVFSLEKDGGILRSEGVIDMANAIDSSGRYVHEDKVFPGIFVVVTSGDLRGGMVAELIAVAKRDLKPGDELDGAGGYAVYGLSERYRDAREKRLLPFGFAYGGKVKRAVARDQALSWDDVEVARSGFLYELREEQDRLFG